MEKQTKEKAIREAVKKCSYKEICEEQKYQCNLGIQHQKDKEVKWLQSVLDTKHIEEGSRWIIEGRLKQFTSQTKQKSENISPPKPKGMGIRNVKLI